jgi:hypothetical protein
MKPHKNTTKDPERPKTGNHKKTDKPWRLEHMFTDKAVIDEAKWFHEGKETGVWYRDHWEKFTTVEQGVRELNKQGRSAILPGKKETIKNHWRFKGRELRLVNIETHQIIPLVITDQEIYVKQDQGSLHSGASGSSE